MLLILCGVWLLVAGLVSLCSCSFSYCWFWWALSGIVITSSGKRLLPFTLVCNVWLSVAVSLVVRLLSLVGKFTVIVALHRHLVLTSLLCLYEHVCRYTSHWERERDFNMYRCTTREFYNPLTNLCLVSHKRDIGKQCTPRSDTTHPDKKKTNWLATSLFDMDLSKSKVGGSTRHKWVKRSFTYSFIVSK